MLARHQLTKAERRALVEYALSLMFNGLVDRLKALRRDYSDVYRSKRHFVAQWQDICEDRRILLGLTDDRLWCEVRDRLQVYQKLTSDLAAAGKRAAQENIREVQSMFAQRKRGPRKLESQSVPRKAVHDILAAGLPPEQERKEINAAEKKLEISKDALRGLVQRERDRRRKARARQASTQLHE
jgi:hypothetical protein